MTTDNFSFIDEIAEKLFFDGDKFSNTGNSSRWLEMCIDEAKQALISNFKEVMLEVIGEDEKEFTKQSRPYEDSATDKLWDLANGVEPISSGQISTWGGCANTQFRKFALKLRNTIWKEAELHKNELRAEQRAALESMLSKSKRR